MKPSPHTTRFEGRGFRIAFWVCASFGFLVMSAGWLQLGLAIYEESSEQDKALAAGQTMEGFAVIFGVIPLVFVHAVGLTLLLTLGWRGWRGRGLIYGAAAVVAVSILGLIVAQILAGGALFGTSNEYVP